jgi:DnaJ-class molecular chaperone
MTTHIIGSIVQLTHVGAATEPPSTTLGRECPTCKGNGYIEWFDGPNRHTETCTDCDGEGTIVSNPHMDEGLTQ